MTACAFGARRALRLATRAAAPSSAHASAYGGRCREGIKSVALTEFVLEQLLKQK